MQQRIKKTFGLALSSLFFLFFISSIAYAAPACDESASGSAGLVPCGKHVTTTIVNGQPQYTLDCPCQLSHIGILLMNVYTFVMKDLVFPAAGLMVVVGGVMVIMSGANPELAGKGKKVLIRMAWAFGLALAAWVIVDNLLKALGYNGSWSILPF